MFAVFEDNEVDPDTNVSECIRFNLWMIFQSIVFTKCLSSCLCGAVWFLLYAENQKNTLSCTPHLEKDSKSGWSVIVSRLHVHAWLGLGQSCNADLELPDPSNADR